MGLTEELEALVARATAVTLGADRTTDTEALLAESNPMWGQVGAHAVEMLPVVDRLVSSLTRALADAPAAVTDALAGYYSAGADARFEPVTPPREVVAFLILDALERIRSHCATVTAASRA